MKNILFTFLILLVGFSVGLAIFYFPFSFNRMSLEEQHHHVITYRDLGIRNAIAKGDYRCCVEPACKMCYMQGNMWNHGEEGTCSCSDFIAEGKEPCPQCEKALSESKEQSCFFENNKDDNFCLIK